MDVDGFVDEGWPLAGVAWPDPSAEPFELDDVFPILIFGRRQGSFASQHCTSRRETSEEKYSRSYDDKSLRSGLGFSGIV